MAVGVVAPFLVVIRVRETNISVLHMVVESVAQWMDVANLLLEGLACALVTAEADDVLWTDATNLHSHLPDFVSSTAAEKLVDILAARKLLGDALHIAQLTVGGFDVNWTVAIAWRSASFSCVERMVVVQERRQTPLL